MDKIKVLVSGCNGHMGQIVCKSIEESDDMEVVAGFDTAMREFSNFPVFETITNLVDSYADEYLHPDVIIDFSSPECSIDVLESYARKHKIPMVIATTGFSEEQLTSIEKIALEVPVFISSNMSYDINVLKNVLQTIAPLLSNCNIEVLEIHHNKKKDAPSGTAKMLAETIKSSLENSKEIIYGMKSKRDPKEIGIASLGGGDVVGTHSVYFFSKYGEIEITSRENTKAAFAEGAIKAAQFLVTSNETAGLFDMDVLTDL